MTKKFSCVTLMLTLILVIFVLPVYSSALVSLSGDEVGYDSSALISTSEDSMNIGAAAPLHTVSTSNTYNRTSVPQYASNSSPVYGGALNQQLPRNIEAGSVYKNSVRTNEYKPEPLRTNKANITNKNVASPSASGTVVTDDILLYLEHIEFEGNTVISDKELQKLAELYLIGRDVTLSYVSKFVEQITNYYQIITSGELKWLKRTADWEEDLTRYFLTMRLTRRPPTTKIP